MDRHWLGERAEGEVARALSLLGGEVSPDPKGEEQRPEESGEEYEVTLLHDTRPLRLSGVLRKEAGLERNFF